MKQFLLLALIFFSKVVTAQEITSGSFANIEDAHIVNFIVDWSDCRINGNTIDEWVNHRQSERPEYDAKVEFEEEFKPLVIQNALLHCNKRTKKVNFSLVRHQQTEYVLTAKVLEFNTDGSHKFFFTFTKSSDNSHLLEFILKDHSHFMGSIREQISDGLDNIGDNLGSFLRDGIIAARKRI